MTKFINLGGVLKAIEEKKSTVFTGLLDSTKMYIECPASSQPHNYKIVIFIGHDEIYGDVFKAYDNDPNNFTLFFGIKGDEF